MAPLANTLPEMLQKCKIQVDDLLFPVEYISYSEELITLNPGAEGGLIVTFAHKDFADTVDRLEDIQCRVRTSRRPVTVLVEIGPDSSRHQVLEGRDFPTTLKQLGVE